MECTRCGGEAVVKRDNAVYCGKCALARDWQEIIHVVQNDRVSLSSKPAAAPPPSKPDSAPPTDVIPAPQPGSAEKAPAEAPKAEATAPEASEGQAAPEAKADPFS